MSVLAHEVGHHVNQDLSWYGQFEHPWTQELQADFISGYVLARMVNLLVATVEPWGSIPLPGAHSEAACIRP